MTPPTECARPGDARKGAADTVSAVPSILWITTDQQRHDTIRALGNARIRTPSLDRLCA